MTASEYIQHVYKTQEKINFFMSDLLDILNTYGTVEKKATKSNLYPILRKANIANGDSRIAGHKVWLLPQALLAAQQWEARQ